MANDQPNFIISVRFLIALIAFLGYGVQYIQRINMSVAIVCMVNNTALDAIKAAEAVTMEEKVSLPESDTVKCQFDSSQNTGGTKLDGPYIWNSKIRGYILSAYFWGYITTQVAGGFMSTIFGAKIVLGIAILIGSILTLLSPAASDIDFKVLFVCRFFTGVSHGAFWPAMSSLWAHWAPKNERSKLVGIANAGSQIGNVAALSLGGFLCVNGFAGGWPSIFYVFGAVGIVWFILWMTLTSKSPSDHRFIRNNEREYILEGTGMKNAVEQKKTVMQAIREVPWLGIVKSKAFWALVFAHSSSNFGTYLFLTQLPTYMKQILKFDIKSNGLLSSLPYIAFWVFIIGSSIIGDFIVQSKKLSITTVRKIFNTLGLVLPAAAVIALAFVSCAVPYIGVALLTAGLATTGCGYGAGFMVNYNDVAGKYAGITFGMANTFGTVSGIVAPTFVGLLTPKGRQSEWSLVFYITAGIYLIGAIAYILLGSGEKQDWAAEKKAPEKDVEESIPLNQK